MNFSVSHAEGWPCFNPTAGPAWLIKEPYIHQLMRISIVLLAIMLTSLQMLLATPGSGQGIESTAITLELKGESLESALKKIERLTSFRFVYRNKEIRKIDDLTLPAAKRTVSETLLLLLENTPFTFKEINNNVLIIPKEEARLDSESSEAVAVSGVQEQTV